mgnify:FL=1
MNWLSWTSSNRLNLLFLGCSIFFGFSMEMLEWLFFLSNGSIYSKGEFFCEWGWATIVIFLGAGSLIWVLVRSMDFDLFFYFIICIENHCWGSLLRQVGHSILISIHDARHYWWKRWLQGVTMTTASCSRSKRRPYYCMARVLSSFEKMP